MPDTEMKLLQPQATCEQMCNMLRGTDANASGVKAHMGATRSDATAAASALCKRHSRRRPSGAHEPAQLRLGDGRL